MDYLGIFILYFYALGADKNNEKSSANNLNLIKSKVKNFRTGIADCAMSCRSWWKICFDLMKLIFILFKMTWLKINLKLMQELQRIKSLTLNWAYAKSTLLSSVERYYFFAKLNRYFECVNCCWLSAVCCRINSIWVRLAWNQIKKPLSQLRCCQQPAQAKLMNSVVVVVAATQVSSTLKWMQLLIAIRRAAPNT